MHPNQQTTNVLLKQVEQIREVAEMFHTKPDSEQETTKNFKLIQVLEELRIMHCYIFKLPSINI